MQLQSLFVFMAVSETVISSNAVKLWAGRAERDCFPEALTQC